MQREALTDVFSGAIMRIRQTKSAALVCRRCNSRGDQPLLLRPSVWALSLRRKELDNAHSIFVSFSAVSNTSTSLGPMIAASNWLCQAPWPQLPRFSDSARMSTAHSLALSTSSFIQCRRHLCQYRRLHRRCFLYPHSRCGHASSAAYSDQSPSARGSITLRLVGPGASAVLKAVVVQEAARRDERVIVFNDEPDRIFRLHGTRCFNTDKASLLIIVKSDPTLGKVKSSNRPPVEANLSVRSERAGRAISMSYP